MFKALVTNMLASAGIEMNGSRPWDIQVHNERFYSRAVLFGSLGVADSYTEGDFTCGDLGQFLELYMRHRQRRRQARVARGLSPRTSLPTSFPEAWIRLQLQFRNPQSISKAKRVGKHHYDIGNTLYRLMLGPTMAYTCAYWPGAKDLDHAQRNKFRHICEKLGLKPGQRVLEIGCGWGGFAAFAAREYGVTVIGLSISQEQIKCANEEYKDLVEERRVSFLFQDYRLMPNEWKGTFDAVVSIGMFEHVGPKNYDEYFRVAWHMLKDGGGFLLHTIVGNEGYDPFIWYRIFPGGILPKEGEIARAVKPLFVVENVENFGFDYSRTLAAWWENCIRHRKELQSLGYGDQFFRQWEFYLKSSEIGFKIRRYQLNQWMLLKGGVEGGYQWNRPIYPA